MGRLCSSNQEEIKNFVSILNISVDSEALQGAAERICRGEALGDAGARTISWVRKGLEDELNRLTSCEELTGCFVDAMAVLRRVTSGEFVWKVFCNSEQGRCKRPRTDYNKAFRSIRTYFRNIWAWNAERGGYSLPDAIRILLLYDLLSSDPRRFGDAHIAAAKVYREMIGRQAEYMNPDFAPFVIEYAFHIGCAVKALHGLFPLQTVPKNQVRSLEIALGKNMSDLRKEKNLEEFLKNTELGSELRDRCIQRLSLDEEVMRVTGMEGPESSCALILG